MAAVASGGALRTEALGGRGTDAGRGAVIASVLGNPLTVWLARPRLSTAVLDETDPKGMRAHGNHSAH